MNNFREYLIHHNDQDASWWPFSSLKPAQHQFLSWTRCFGLACLYLVPALLLLILADALLGGATTWYSALMLLGVSVAPATVAFRLLIGRSWNARAAILQSLSSRRERYLSQVSAQEEQAD